jgi:hypothetical protein
MSEPDTTDSMVEMEPGWSRLTPAHPGRSERDVDPAGYHARNIAAQLEQGRRRAAADGARIRGVQARLLRLSLDETLSLGMLGHELHGLALACGYEPDVRLGN